MALITRQVLRRFTVESDRYPFELRTKTASSILTNAAGVSPDERFDVFLSHSYSDAAQLDATDLLRLKKLLETFGFRVYVDWIVDHNLDRQNVTPATAALLRLRMDHSRSLLYATSQNASKSKWMPWELGYFDGKIGRVAILPIDNSTSPQSKYNGQEYLGLYPYITLARDTQNDEQLWVEEPNGKYTTFSGWINGGTLFRH